MAATLMDGKALAERIRAEVGGGRARARRRRARRRCSSATTRRRRSTSGSSTGRDRGRHPRGRPAPARPTTREDELLATIAELNADDAIARAARPAAAARPRSTRSASIRAVDPAKDVDGFHPDERRRALPRPAGLVPATARRRDGAARRVRRSSSRALAPSSSGGATIVGKPTAHLLLEQANATVTICHSRTRDLARAHARRRTCSSSPSAAPALVAAEMVKPGAAVIDVGINRTDDGPRRRRRSGRGGGRRLPHAGAGRRRADDDRVPARERRHLRPHTDPLNAAVSIHFDSVMVRPASRPSRDGRRHHSKE